LINEARYLYFTLVLPINVVFFGDFTAFFAADFLAAGVFAAEDILSNKTEKTALLRATKFSQKES
jgi:hypothetical protein